MTTLGELVERTRHSLTASDSRRESVGALTSPATASDLEFRVDAPGMPADGIVEIDLEQIRVKSTSETDGQVTAWSFGRGYRGTTAAAHDVGTEVRFQPTWPASTVAREINGVLTEIYPQLYAVKTHDTAVPSTFGAIDVPTDAVGGISVWVEDEMNAGEWIREDRWDFNPDGNPGSGLRIGGHHRSGLGVRFVYAARPQVFDLDAGLEQDFASVTGMDDRISDLLLLGVARRMAPFVDVSLLSSLSAAPADARKEPTAGSTSARLLHSLFLARLDSEAAALAKEHPIRVHKVR